MKHLAIVGAGPAGFYSALRLLTHYSGPLKIDFFEKQAVPFGLVRFGVAPDHPEVKNCEERFDEVGDSKNVSFFGNVVVGRDVQVSDLVARYNCVLFSYGASQSRHLSVRGSDHRAVISARDFVGWYNGDPDYQDITFPLRESQDVSIVGNGNVALDVARVLLRKPDELTHTDITDQALDVLATSRVRNVNIVGRRDILHSAFTNKELRELLTEPGVEFTKPSLDGLELYKDLMTRVNKRKIDLIKKGSRSQGDRSWELSFLRSPVEFLSSTPNTLDGIKWAVNKLSGPLDNPVAEETGEFVTTKSELAFTSIGYKGTELTGMGACGIPFDQRRGIIPTNRSRIADTNCFATGWIKTGPQGVIVSTMMDAFSTGEEIAAYLPTDETDKPGLGDLLANKTYTTWEDWKQVDAEEKKLGKEKGKPREKFTSTKAILEFLHK